MNNLYTSTNGAALQPRGIKMGRPESSICEMEDDPVQVWAY